MKRAVGISMGPVVLGVASICAAPSLGAGIAYIELEGSLSDQADGLAALTGDVSPTLSQFVRGVEKLAWNEDVDGVLLHLRDAALGVTQIEEISAALASVRENGKQVHLFAEGYSNQEILLGAACDHRLMQRGGGVMFTGVSTEEMYLADMMSWVGIQAELIQVGDYKGANETQTRSAPSDAWNTNISGLLDSAYAVMSSTIEGGYGVASMDDAFGGLWLASGAEAVRRGVLTAEVDLPELEAYLESAYGEAITWASIEPFGDASNAIDTSNPFGMIAALAEPPAHGPDEPSIAVLHISGAIVDGESAGQSSFGGGTTGARTIRRAIEDMLDEELIEGVVVRIESPGGSAIASEVIWQGIERLKEAEIPVWVSVGGMAASGGYYIAVAGEEIYVNESSIVGSIGVVGGKYNLGGVYDKLRVNVVHRSRGPNADLFASGSSWTDRQRSLVRERMTETYELFTSRVEAGRPGLEISKAGEGRLFTGADAIELKMADAIGGLDVAVGDLAAEIGLDEYGVISYPAPRSVAELLEEAFGGFVGMRAVETLVSTLAQPLGTELLAGFSAELNAAAQLEKEPVLLTGPRALRLMLD